MQVRNGASQKQIEVADGKYPILATGGEIGRTNTPIYCRESVLIGRKGTIDKPVYMNSPFWTVDTLFYTELADEVNGRFVYAMFQTIPWKRFDTSTGVPSLTSSTIHAIKKSIPIELTEQTRVGEFFRVLDDLIAAAKKKADLLKLKKKYYLQAIFSQRLRFKGFTKPWQQRKLEELCIRVGSGGTPSVQHPEYYNGKIPFLGISDLSGRAVSATQKKITQRGLDNSAAWLVPKGSITLAMYASVGKVAILDIELATSQAFFNMVIPEETCIRDFLFSRLEKADICHEWLPLISTGTQPNLNAAKLKDWELKVPSTQERKTIGEFFHALDDLAAALARKIELLERRKTAYLQRLFV